MHTLLGHLLPLIKVSKQEDIATLSLHYLVETYPALNVSFTRLLSNKLHRSIDRELVFNTQSVGSEKERPDMSGKDLSGNEIVLCEAKFYAGLTDNQPLTYLDRLIKENGAGLMFICPQERMVSLWAALEKRCEGRNVEPIDEYCISVDGMNMALVSWEEVINDLLGKADAVAPESLADIKQLKGFCDKVIDDAFAPFHEDEMGVDVARRLRQSYAVIMKLKAAILADKTIKADTKGLKLAGQKNGVVQYLHIEGWNVAIALDIDLWADENLMDTPFWVGLSKTDESGSWSVTPAMVDCFRDIPNVRKKYNNYIWLALDVPYGLYEDEAMEQMKAQVFDYVRRLNCLYV